MDSYEELVVNRYKRKVELAAKRLPAFWEKIDRFLDMEEQYARRIEKFAEIPKILLRGWMLNLLSEEIPVIDIEYWNGRRIELGEAGGYSLCAVVDPDWVCHYHLLYIPKLLGDVPKITCDAYNIRTIHRLGRPVPITVEFSEWQSFIRIHHLDNIFAALEGLGRIVKRKTSPQ